MDPTSALPKRTVSELMNRELLYIEEGVRVDLAKAQILDFGVTAVPVLDEEHRPVGVVSLRDLVHGEHPRRISSPARTIRADASLEQAARALAEQSLHHLVVVDVSGRAVGMLSALDILSALVGLPSTHPQRFAERDERDAAKVAEEGESTPGIRVP